MTHPTFVLIGCRPISMSPGAAIGWVRHLLAPTKPDYLSVWGLSVWRLNCRGMFETVNKVRERDSGNCFRSSMVPRWGVLFTRGSQIHQSTVISPQPYIQQVKNLGVPRFFKVSLSGTKASMLTHPGSLSGNHDAFRFWGGHQ